MIKGYFNFHGIGQGLFYSGQICKKNDVFNFVYDCGTFYKKDYKLLHDKIQSCFYTKDKSKETINALFISHLHRDHVSGLAKLFECYDVKNVFIPFFSPEELILLCIENNIGIGSELFSLYNNTLKYFEDKGVEYVYLIKPNWFNNNSLEDFVEKTEQLHIENPNMNIYCENKTKLNTLSKTIVYSVRNLSFVVSNAYWEFRIYQDQDEKEQEKIRNKIKKLYKSIINCDEDIDLKAALNSDIFIEETKKLYDKIKYNINQSSLLLYHGPLSNEDKLTYAFYDNKCSCCYFGNDFASCTEVSTLLTGDINLNYLTKKGKKLECFLFDVSNDIGFFMIPHHGSYKNMSINILNKLFQNPVRKICSYGKHNHFGHPDAYMLDSIFECSCGQIYHVVQNHDFRYSLTVKQTP